MSQCREEMCDCLHPARWHDNVHLLDAQVPPAHMTDEAPTAAEVAALTAERDEARAGWDKALWELEQNRASHLVDIATHNGAGWQLRRDKDGWQRRAEKAEAALRQAVPREPTNLMLEAAQFANPMAGPPEHLTAQAVAARNDRHRRANRELWILMWDTYQKHHAAPAAPRGEP